jgi:hypothetical protein
MASFWDDFAAGFVPAFNKSYQQAEQHKHEQALLDKKIEAERASKLGGSLKDLKKKRMEREAMSAQLATLGAALKKRHGVSDETINRLIATGDIAGMQKLVSDADGLVSEYQKTGRTPPSGIISSSIESAVLTPASVTDINLSEFNLGDLDPTEFDTEIFVPGAISAPTPTAIERPDLEDLDRMQKIAVSGAREQASYDLQKINRATGAIQKAEQSGTLSPEDAASAQEDKAFLSRRMVSVKSALDAASGDDPTYSNLISLYGADYFKKLISGYPEFANSPYPDSFTTFMGTDVPTLTNENQAYRMSVHYGILNPGDTVYLQDSDEYVTIPEF